MAAAFLDLPTTGALYKAIARGEAPRPTGQRGLGASLEPVWARCALEQHVEKRHRLDKDAGQKPQDATELI